MKPIFTTFKRLLAVFAFVILPSVILAQYQIIQRGNDIDGEAPGDYSGLSVSMPDAFTIAIGAPFNNGNGNNSGHVRIFKWDGIAWVQKGADIDGDAGAQESGYAVSMPDSNTVAVGSISTSPDFTGHVRIFSWNGSSWIKKGATIVGDTVCPIIGHSVSMPDSNTIAIGSDGCVVVYSWEDTAWVKKGSHLNGFCLGKSFGTAVSMPNKNTVAIGAPEFGYGPWCPTGTGFVQTFYWDGLDWVQKGATLTGDSIDDMFGVRVSMPDSNTIAIGAMGYSIYVPTFMYQPGLVRIFEWSGSSWLQKGSDIIGMASSEQFGSAVSMPDINTVGISTIGWGSGHVRIYGWDGMSWNQKGLDINSEYANDYYRGSVSMPDSSTLAIGGPENYGNGSNAGHVRVYDVVSNVGYSENSLSGIQIFPNPTSGTLNLELINNPFDENTKIILYDLLGNKLLKETTGRVGKTFTLNVGHLSSGVYILKVVQNGEVLRTERVIVSK